MVELGALRVRARGMRIHALMLKSKWISCFENYLWIKTFDFPTEIGLSFLERSQADAEFRSWNVHCILVARRCVVDWNATRKWNEVRFGYQCHGNIYRFSKLEKAHFHGLSLSLSLNAMHIASKLRNLSFKSTQFEMRLLLFGCAYVCVCVDACKSVSVSQTNDDIGYSGFELAAGAQ